LGFISDPRDHTANIKKKWMSAFVNLTAISTS